MQNSNTLKEVPREFETPKEFREIQAYSLDWGVDDAFCDPLCYNGEHPPTVGRVAFELGVVLAVCLALALAARLALLIGG